MRAAWLLAMAGLIHCIVASPGEPPAIHGQAGTLLRLRGGSEFLSALSEKWAGLLRRSNVPSGPKIIISGAPASGKGTQCEFIVKKFGVVHISTGDALREQVKAGTELGKMAKGYMSKGALVPDDLIIDIVKDRLAEEDCSRKGWLLDGFPRTGVQAEAMRKAGITAEHFILLNVPDEVLIERVLGRRTDPKTGKIYHLEFNPPPNDKVKRRLIQRSDDNLEAIKSRIAQYKDNVNAVRGYFRPITHELDGVGDKNVIAAKIASIIMESR